MAGRWNVKGRPAVYLSEHLSLTALEVLVHTTKSNLPDHVSLHVDVEPDIAIFTPALSDLPAAWRDLTAPEAARDFAEEWFTRGEEALMRVPSVIIPTEFNYILNPAHPDAERIKRTASVPERFTFDPRLLHGLAP